MERRGVRHGFAAVLSLLVLAGCTDGSSEAEPPPPELELGFTQLLPEEGTDQALLRVINLDADPITVTSLGIDWAGYGGEAGGPVEEKVVPAESELMIRFELPEPACDSGETPPPDPVRGTLTVNGRDLTQPLTDPAQVYVQRLWRTQCDQRLLDESLQVRFAEHYRRSSGPGGDLVRAWVVLTRVSGNQPIRVASAEGSVLYGLRVTRATTLRPGSESMRVGLEILPGTRCDEHAIGQATAPYDFSLALRIGSRSVRHALQPPLKIQNAASTMLLHHCGTLGAQGE